MRRHGAHREQFCLRGRAIRCNRRIRALQFVTTTAICLTASRALSACAGRSARLLACGLVAWLVFGSFQDTRANTYTWNLDGNGNWDVSPNWIASPSAYPNAIDDVAIFGNAITGAAIISVP